MSGKRKKCSYPMSKFYIYKDEIPANTRVSTFKDCENCDGFEDNDCSERHCLITEK